MRCRPTSLVKHLKIKCLIALEGLDHLDRTFIAALRRRGVAIVVIGMAKNAVLANKAGEVLMPRERLRQVDLFLVGEGSMDRRPDMEGVAPDNVKVVEGLTGAGGMPPGAVTRVVEILKPFLAQHTSVIRSQGRRRGLGLETVLEWMIERPTLRWLLSPRIRRLETIEDLRCALGEPRSILCLGNGPSSEDHALGELAHDSLFRVNDRWLERGFLVKPDVVFTGSDKTLARVRETVFALSNVPIETMLLRKWLLRRPFRRLTYFSPERAGILPLDPAGTSQPTNGVIMLATAVALQPDRLIVGGIDLFQDPHGAYPDDPVTPNAYAAAHERSVELRFILEILHRYRGQLMIVGDVLRRHWEDSRRAGPACAYDGLGLPT